MATPSNALPGRVIETFYVHSKHLNDCYSFKITGGVTDNNLINIYTAKQFPVWYT